MPKAGGRLLSDDEGRGEVGSDGESWIAVQLVESVHVVSTDVLWIWPSGVVGCRRAVRSWSSSNSDDAILSGCSSYDRQLRECIAEFV